MFRAIRCWGERMVTKWVFFIGFVWYNKKRLDKKYWSVEKLFLYFPRFPFITSPLVCISHFLIYKRQIIQHILFINYQTIDMLTEKIISDPFYLNCFLFNFFHIEIIPMLLALFYKMRHALSAVDKIMVTFKCPSLNYLYLINCKLSWIKKFYWLKNRANRYPFPFGGFKHTRH